MKIGHKMQEVVEYVQRNQGCTKLAAGRAHWGNRKGRMAYLYGPVNRAIENGLVYAERQSNGSYKLYPVSE